MTTISDLNFDATRHLFSFLTPTEILKMRATSKRFKAIAEQTKDYQKLQKNIENIKNIHFELKKSIEVASPKFLYSNQIEVKLITQSNTLLCLNPDHSFQFHSKCSLNCSREWKKVVWTHDKVAAFDHMDFFRSNIRVYDTQNGTLLKKCVSKLYPICWHKGSLLLRTMSLFPQTESPPITLARWDIAYDSPPETVCMLSDNAFKMKVSENGTIFICTESLQPFHKFDISTQTLYPLQYEIHKEDKVKNFGVTAQGNLFFSKGNSIVLLETNTMKEIAKIESSCNLQKIRFQFPFLAFCKERGFLIYDIRKPNKPICDYDYLTLKKKIKIALFDKKKRASIQHRLSVHSLLFHNSFIFVRKKDEMDCFALNSSLNK